MENLIKIANENKHFQLYSFSFILLAALAVVFFVMKPFLYPFIMALVFAVILNPVYNKVLEYFKGKRHLSSVFVVVITVLVVLIPLSMVGVKMSLDASKIYSTISSNGSSVVSDIKNLSQESVSRIFSGVGLSSDGALFVPDLGSYIEEGVNWILRNLSVIFSSLSVFIFNSVLFLIMLYYILIYSDSIKKQIITISPFSKSEDRNIINRLEDAIHSVVRGSIIKAVVQGLLAGIGFLIFGVPGAVLWGSVAAIASVVPSVGTALVLIPGIVFLWLSGNFFSAIGLLVWGMLIVGLADNLLSLFVFKGNYSLHPFLVLLAVLGGIAFWGPVGFILGPISLAFLFALFDLRFPEVEQKLKHE